MRIDLSRSKKNVNEELQKILELTKKRSDLLGSIYDDFYGANKESKRVSNSLDESIRKMRADVEKAVDPAITDQEALQKADDAIKEAKEMFGQEQAASSEVQAPPAEPERDPKEELDELIGLQTIKHDVMELASFAKIQKMRKDQGLKAVPISMHLVFTGNPGTGKTTVARILARLYKNIGVLSKGQLVEVDRSGLVAGYVGQTALKTQEQIKRAMGGVLFVDEAYALSQKDDNFGQEAIDTILKAMEDHRDDLVVIVAGYTEPMKKFINSNPGLKSRFNKYIEFEDYSVDELEQIFYLNCKKYDYKVDEDIKHHIRTMIAARKLLKLENFANAREVRNMFEEIIANQARRVSAIENPSVEDMMRICLDDLSDITPEKKKELEANAAEETKPAQESETAEAAEPAQETEAAEEAEPAQESETAEPAEKTSLSEDAPDETEPV